MVVLAALLWSVGVIAAPGRFSLRTNGPNMGWQLYDPNGKPFFVVAVNHLAPPYFFEQIQGANGLTPCRQFDLNCMQQDVFRKKYNGSWAAASRDFIETTRSWGFNAAGYEFVPSPDPSASWPYLPDLFITNASHIFQKGGSLSFSDVFSDSFNATTEERVRDWCARDQHINLPRRAQDVIGYYFEDQPLWGIYPARTKNRPAEGPTDWTSFMRSLPASADGKRVYVDWLAGKYDNSTEGLARARKIYNIPESVQTWDALREWNFATVNGTKGKVIYDDTEFLGVVAERLFSISAEAVRRYDPGALVFGQRFRGDDVPDVVLEAAGRHFDVLSIQPGRFSYATVEEAKAGVQILLNNSRTAGLPVMVADQNSHFVEVAAFNLTNCQYAESCTPNQAEAGKLYTAYLEELRRNPEFIGYAHCQYINRAVRQGGKTTDSLKQGLLNFNGTPHEEYVGIVTKANTAANAGSYRSHD